MNIEGLLKLRDSYNAGIGKISNVLWEKYGTNFDITYTHESTAMEGNTLTLMETKVLLEDNISIGGKALREIYEVVNHNKAYTYIKDALHLDQQLSETMIKDIHQILTENIMIGGIYRNVDVYISGAGHTPPSPNEMYKEVQNFYTDLPWKQEQLNPIELAAWGHAEFVRIHPFVDGNGRISRLIMNYLLMQNSFLPISIPVEMRLAYYAALEEYAVHNNLEPFTQIVGGLEEKRLQDVIALIDQANR